VKEIRLVYKRIRPSVTARIANAPKASAVDAAKEAKALAPAQSTALAVPAARPAVVAKAQSSEVVPASPKRQAAVVAAPSKAPSTDVVPQGSIEDDQGFAELLPQVKPEMREQFKAGYARLNPAERHVFLGAARAYLKQQATPAPEPPREPIKATAVRVDQPAAKPAAQAEAAAPAKSPGAYRLGPNDLDPVHKFDFTGSSPTHAAGRAIQDAVIAGKPIPEFDHNLMEGEGKSAKALRTVYNGALARQTSPAGAQREAAPQKVDDLHSIHVTGNGRLAQAAGRMQNEALDPPQPRVNGTYAFGPKNPLPARHSFHITPSAKGKAAGAVQRIQTAALARAAAIRAATGMPHR